MPLAFTLATLQAAFCLLMEDGDRDARPDASEPTVEFSLNAGGLRLLLDAVTFRLDRWPGRRLSNAVRPARGASHDALRLGT